MKKDSTHIPPKIVSRKSKSPPHRRTSPKKNVSLGKGLSVRRKNLTVEITDAANVSPSKSASPLLNIDVASPSLETTRLPSPLSPTAQLAAHGFPTCFIILIVLCFFEGIVALVAFCSYAASKDDPESKSIYASSAFTLGVGITNSMVGSLQTASGYCCQRLAHNVVRRDNSLGPATRQPIYITGLLLLTVGTIAAIINLGLLGQSVTAPFAALTLFYNALLAHQVLKEKLTKWDLISSILVLIGVTLAVLGVSLANLEVQSFILDELEIIFFEESFLPIGYTVAMILFLIIISFIVSIRQWEKCGYGLFCFSFTSGILAGFTSLCVKCSIELLKGAIKRNSGDEKSPYSYLFVLGIPICLLSQLNYMNKGFLHFGTLKFVPPYHATMIFANMINGMIYFGELKSYNTKAVCLFVLGSITAVIGVLILVAKATDGGSNESSIEQDHIANSKNHEYSNGKSNTSLGPGKNSIKKEKNDAEVQSL